MASCEPRFACIKQECTSCARLGIVLAKQLASKGRWRFESVHEGWRVLWVTHRGSLFACSGCACVCCSQLATLAWHGRSNERKEAQAQKTGIRLAASVMLAHSSLKLSKHERCKLLRQQSLSTCASTGGKTTGMGHAVGNEANVGRRGQRALRAS